MQFRVDHETISLCRHAAPIAEVKRSGDRHLTDKVNGAVGRSVGRPEDGRAPRAGAGRGAGDAICNARARVGWGSVISPRRPLAALGHVRTRA